MSHVQATTSTQANLPTWGGRIQPSHRASCDSESFGNGASLRNTLRIHMGECNSHVLRLKKRSRFKFSMHLAPYSVAQTWLTTKVVQTRNSLKRPWLEDFRILGQVCAPVFRYRIFVDFAASIHCQLPSISPVYLANPWTSPHKVKVDLIKFKKQLWKFRRVSSKYLSFIWSKCHLN